MSNRPSKRTQWYTDALGRTRTSGAVRKTALASESALLFSAGERLRLADLRNLPAAYGTGRPLVFINACEG